MEIHLFHILCQSIMKIEAVFTFCVFCWPSFLRLYLSSNWFSGHQTHPFQSILQMIATLIVFKHWCFIPAADSLIVSRELQLKVPLAWKWDGKVDIDASSNNGNLMMLWSWLSWKGGMRQYACNVIPKWAWHRELTLQRRFWALINRWIWCRKCLEEQEKCVDSKPWSSGKNYLIVWVLAAQNSLELSNPAETSHPVHWKKNTNYLKGKQSPEPLFPTKEQLSCMIWKLKSTDFINYGS